MATDISASGLPETKNPSELRRLLRLDAEWSRKYISFGEENEFYMFRLARRLIDQAPVSERICVLCKNEGAGLLKGKSIGDTNMCREHLIERISTPIPELRVQNIS